MSLIEAQADLETAQLAVMARTQQAERDAPARPESNELEARILEEFQKDPEVVELVNEINKLQDQFDKVKKTVRRPGDPALQGPLARLKKLKTEHDEELWPRKHEEIRQKLLGRGPVLGPDAPGPKITELQARIERLKKQQVSLATRLDKLKVETKTMNKDGLKAKFADLQLSMLFRLHETVGQKLKQVEFDTEQESYRISVRNPAAVPMSPSINKRLRYLAVAPVGIVFLMLGLFLLREIQAERVGDPEAQSSRVQSEVYALPPLPTARSIRKRNQPGADDQIEQFIQRLDHLRFAVCGNPADLQKGRCVLITSAVGGEGKTTLAAQLAARCGNAGMSTLLIDADLRRTGLCSLLDVPEGSGLSDVLLDDKPSATELVVPVQGGAFHLLPAGSPVQDTSSMLQNRKLGLLITQFRQLYDLIIIDSPPVLPVPDALIMGRWADGAVLAVRYDISRFPQVERARHQLDGAGIAVLGTVINGLRNSDSYYGRYSYNRRRSSSRDSSGAT
jgi:capsular exopolysaccharide synthesis family protein